MGQITESIGRYLEALDAVDAEEKIRIVPEGLRGEFSIAEFCRKEGVSKSLYCKWSKEFLEAGKKWLAGDTERQTTTGEIKDCKAARGSASDRRSILMGWTAPASGIEVP
jgi:transposase-like protein